MNDYQEKLIQDQILIYQVDKKNYSTVIWFHGGGLNSGERSIPEELKNNGIAVVAVGYRLSPMVKAPIYIEDAAASVAWVFNNIGEYCGSKRKIYILGHSAGAYLASMLAFDKRWLAVHEIDADKLAGLIALSGQAITHLTVRQERGISDTCAVVDDLAPVYHVRPDAAPVLLITGDRELEILGRYEENAYMWRMLKVVGHQDVILHELKGYDHCAMLSPAFPILLDFMSGKDSSTRN